MKKKLRFFSLKVSNLFDLNCLAIFICQAAVIFSISSPLPILAQTTVAPRYPLAHNFKTNRENVFLPFLKLNLDSRSFIGITDSPIVPRSTELQSCNTSAELEPLLNLLKQAPDSGSPIRAWSQFESQIDDSTAKSASLIYESFRRSEWTIEKSNLVKFCLDESGFDLSERLQFSISQVFFQKTVDLLRKSTAPEIQNFVRMVTSQDFRIFRVYGHFRESTPADKKGGFHRGKKWIFLDFEKIPSNEWNILFIHEFIHSLDSLLPRAIAVYGDPKMTEIFSIWISKVSDFSEIPEEYRTAIRQWLFAGLDRGLLAECRAWTLTLELYRLGIQENLWKPVDWLENILQKQKMNESTSHLVIRLLSPNFIDPDSGIFKNGIIQRELLKIRQDLISDRFQLSLGNLASLLEK